VASGDVRLTRCREGQVNDGGGACGRGQPAARYPALWLHASGGLSRERSHPERWRLRRHVGPPDEWPSNRGRRGAAYRPAGGVSISRNAPQRL